MNPFLMSQLNNYVYYSTFQDVWQHADPAVEARVWDTFMVRLYVQYRDIEAAVLNRARAEVDRL